MGPEDAVNRGPVLNPGDTVNKTKSPALVELTVEQAVYTQ